MSNEKKSGYLNMNMSNIRLLHNVECFEHLHFNMEICIVTKGQLKVKRETKEYLLNKGMCIFIMPYEIHSYVSLDKTETIIIEVSTVLFDELNNRGGFAAGAFSLKDETLNYVKNKIKYKNESEIFLKALVYPIADDFFNSCTLPEVSAVHSQIYLAAIEYIAKNCGDDINLKTAAASIGCSYVYLSRVFSKNVGISFTAYLNRYRITRSLTDLKYSNMLITEIAYSCGFGNLRSYNREFKKCLNMTPKQYRKHGYILHCED